MRTQALPAHSIHENKMNRRRWWRQVETGDVNRMELRLGGERRMFWVGIFGLAVGLLGTVLLLTFFLAEIQTLRSLVPPLGSSLSGLLWAYSLIASAISVPMFQGICLAVWLAFRSHCIIINKETGEVRTYFRLLWFATEKICCLNNGSAISFGWDYSKLRFLGCHAICLVSDSSKEQRLMLVPWGLKSEGRALAQQIADFLEK